MYNLCKSLSQIKTIQEILRFQLELFATVLLNVVIFINFFLNNHDFINYSDCLHSSQILPSLNRVIQSVNSIRAAYVVIDLTRIT